VYNCFDYRLLEDHAYCRTAYLSTGECANPEIVIAAYSYTGDLAKDKTAVFEIVEQLEPGDILTWTRDDNQGHTLIVVDDMDNDGKLDILHRSGTRYDMTKGVDVKEGGIGFISDAEKTFKSINSGSGLLGTNKIRVSVHRPALLSAEEYPITLNAQARLTYPGLNITRTCEAGVWGSVVSGENLTFTTVVANKSKTDFSGLMYRESVPEGCTLVEVDGKSTTAAVPLWKLDIPANGSVTVTYTLRFDAPAGTEIVNSGGSMAGIESNVIHTTVQNFTPDSAKLTDAATQAAAASASSSDIEFVNKLYELAFGADPQIPAASTVFEQEFVPMPQQYGTRNPQEEYTSALGRMILPRYYGGKKLVTPENGRVLETRFQDIQAGDIILCTTTNPKTDVAWIFDGTNLLTLENGQVSVLNEAELVKVLSYQFFVLLRPSLTLGA